MVITVEKLKIFLEERPSLSVRGIEREAELPSTKIKEFLGERQKLNADQEGRLLNILQKYGWGKKQIGLSALLGDDYSEMGVKKDKASK